MLTASLPVHYMGWDARLVAIHIPEFLLGMAFVHWKRLARLGVLAGCAVLLFTPAAADGKVACALFSAAAFILLAVLGGCTTGCRCKMRVRSSASILMRSF